MPLNATRAVRKRVPEATRERLLQAAFAEIYRNGFRAASLDAILTAAGMTKGALYHHYESKTALGYAVVDDVIRGVIRQYWIEPLQRGTDPLATLAYIRRHQPGDPGHVAFHGCPVNNLAQEMSAIDEGFRVRLDAIFTEWRDAIAEALRRGQAAGRIRADADPESEASFFLAALEGSVSIAKSAQNPGVLEACLDRLEIYMRTLRPVA